MFKWLSFLPMFPGLVSMSFAEDGGGTAVENETNEIGETGTEGETSPASGEEGETGGEPEEEEGNFLDLNGKVKLPNGEIVDAQELLYGYMRQDDYTKKTQELAEARRQLELAQESPEEVKKEDIQEQIGDVKGALEELAPDDPQAKALVTILKKLEKLEAKVEETEKKDEMAAAEEAYNKQVEYMKKLTNDTMDNELKNYRLPTFKNPKTGKDINFADRWKEVVLTTLSGIDQNMTVPEFKALVREIGRKAYERLQDEISAISASYATAKKKPEVSSPVNQTSQAQGEKKNLSLADKISAAFEKIEREKGG